MTSLSSPPRPGSSPLFPAPRPSEGPITLLLGTRKGAFLLRSDAARQSWELSDPLYLGSIIDHFVLDPGDGRTLLMAASTGHLGPTVFRSADAGATWKEAERPPAFRKAAEGEKGRSVERVFSLSPGHRAEEGVWYAGSTPPGLFRSEDGGNTWSEVSGFNDHPMRDAWVGAEQEAPPGGATLHSIHVDPRDPAHLYIGVSCGGVFESTDGGASWQPLNAGSEALFIPTPGVEPDYGHDPHCLAVHPLLPDRLYQQNHCGIYRMDREEGRWTRIGENMPAEVGDIGFPVVLHPRDPDTAWVFPMDGTDVWPRTSPGGRPAVYVTQNAGETWRRQDAGLPEKNAWFTVYRQAMTADAHHPVGLYFGTTGGEVWGSRDGGESWECLAGHLPQVYSVRTAQLRP